MLDTLVIGTGLFGSIIAASLRRRGHDVLTIDDMRPHSGSRPAACLMKPGWYSGLGKDVSEPALRELDELYGVQDVVFRVGPTRTNIQWVVPSKILKPADTQGTVTRLQQIGGGWVASFEDDTYIDYIEARKIVLATGVWAPELAPVKVKGQAGVAFLWPNETIAEPVLSLWAPYRQLVAFNRGDGLWGSDGTSIKQENWTKEYERKAQDRVEKLVGRQNPKRIYGVRPYAEEKPCILRQVETGFWVATGGAKNGTLAAGWCGWRLGNEL